MVRLGHAINTHGLGVIAVERFLTGHRVSSHQRMRAAFNLSLDRLVELAGVP